MKKIISLILALCLLAVSGLALGSCEAKTEEKKSSDTKVSMKTFETKLGYMDARGELDTFTVMVNDDTIELVEGQTKLIRASRGEEVFIATEYETEDYAKQYLEEIKASLENGTDAAAKRSGRIVYAYTSKAFYDDIMAAEKPTDDETEPEVGTLKIELMIYDGNGSWSDGTNEPLISNELWEPGRIVTRTVRVDNIGTLAFNWCVRLSHYEELGILADVIDFYVLVSDALPSYDDRTLSEYTRLGTLNSINDTRGVLFPSDSVYVTFALKMQETAGNEYQSQKLGDLYVYALATRYYTSEQDSFGEQYD